MLGVTTAWRGATGRGVVKAKGTCAFDGNLLNSHQLATPDGRSGKLVEARGAVKRAHALLSAPTAT